MLTIGQTARLIGVSVDTLRNWDESGKLPAIRDENDHRFYKTEQINSIRLNLAAKHSIMLWEDLIKQSFNGVFGVGVDINKDDDVILIIYTKEIIPLKEGKNSSYFKIASFNGYDVEYREVTKYKDVS